MVQLNYNVSRRIIKWYQGEYIIKATGLTVHEEQSGDGYEYRSHLRMVHVVASVSGLYPIDRFKSHYVPIDILYKER